MLFIDLLVLVLRMVCETWRETGRKKAGKNFKVTEPKFSNVTAQNGLAKLYCIIISADRTLLIYARYHLHFPSEKFILYRCVTPIAHNVRNTKSLEIGNMPQKSSELRQAS